MISLNIAKNCARLHEYISQHILGRDIPTDAVIQIRHNGHVLREHSKVRCSDTLYLKAMMQGLHGGSKAKVDTLRDDEYSRNSPL